LQLAKKSNAANKENRAQQGYWYRTGWRLISTVDDIWMTCAEDLDEVPSDWLNEAFHDCLALAGVQLTTATEVIQDSEDIVSANEPVGEDEVEEDDQ
jgi:hypothetical protein